MGEPTLLPPKKSQRWKMMQTMLNNILIVYIMNFDHRISTYACVHIIMCMKSTSTL